MNRIGGSGLAVGLTLLVCSACVPTDNTAAIRSRLDSYAKHLSASDANSLAKDMAPELRKGCNFGEIVLGLTFLKGFNGGKLDVSFKDVKIQSISGKTAEVSAIMLDNGVPFNGSGTSTFKMEKSGSDWYIADGCQGSSSSLALASGSPIPVLGVVSPTSRAPRIGETVSLSDKKDESLSIAVAAVQDPVPGRSGLFGFGPSGRWVSVDWVIRNDGKANYDVYTYTFKLQTSEGHLLTPTALNSTGARPALDYGTIGPGQMLRGFLVYDVPTSASLRSALYQEAGSQQFVIAGLGQ